MGVLAHELSQITNDDHCQSRDPALINAFPSQTSHPQFAIKRMRYQSVELIRSYVDIGSFDPSWSRNCP